MRRTLTGFVFLTVLLAMSCVPAHAQTQISLTATNCNSCFTFTVAGSSLMVTQTSTASGFSLGWGTPAFPTLTKFTLSAVAPILLTASGGGLYTASSGAFDINIMDGSLTALSGVLSIQDLTAANNTATFNTMLTGNFDIKGGSYCSEVGVNCADPGFGKLILFLGSIPIASGTKGGLNPSPLYYPVLRTRPQTPKPTTMLLFGTGLLALGAILRRRVGIA